MTPTSLSLRDGGTSDLRAAYSLTRRSLHHAGQRQGLVPPDAELSDAEIDVEWPRQRALVEFIDAQPEGCFVVGESDGGLVGHARTVRLGDMEQMSELAVEPGRQGAGFGRELLQRCWPGAPTPELGRLVVATGTPADLTLYTNFGVMPVAGHWHLRQRTELYLEQRSNEDRTGAEVHVLKADRALAEWERLEPLALGFHRPALHEFFARGRTCLAYLDADSGDARGVCWVSTEGDIGPAVAAEPGDLVPVVISALDRVAAARKPEYVSVFATTLSWWLLRRLRKLGFVVSWPSWVMCSEPLPGLDRYVPTRPSYLL